LSRRTKERVLKAMYFPVFTHHHPTVVVSVAIEDVSHRTWANPYDLKSGVELP
jgi:hypothetical protein